MLNNVAKLWVFPYTSFSLIHSIKNVSWENLQLQTFFFKMFFYPFQHYIFIYSLKEEQEKTKLLIHQNQEKEDELSEMRLKYMKYFLCNFIKMHYL